MRRVEMGTAINAPRNLPCACRVEFDIARAFVTLSSRGPGHRPFTAVTRVRIPLGSDRLQRFEERGDLVFELGLFFWISTWPGDPFAIRFSIGTKSRPSWAI